jgi:hypothetical protein
MQGTDMVTMIVRTSPRYETLIARQQQRGRASKNLAKILRPFDRVASFESEKDVLSGFVAESKQDGNSQSSIINVFIINPHS